MRRFAFDRLAAIVVVLHAATASAAMIVQESFYIADPANPAMREYAVGNIAGGSTFQNPNTIGSAGAAWQGPTGVIKAVAQGLAYPGASATGGSAEFKYTEMRSIKRLLTTDYDLNSPAYYISGLMSFDANFSTDTTATAYTSFTNIEDTNDNWLNTTSPGSVIFGVQWGFQGNGAGGVNAMMRLRASTSGNPIVNEILAEDIGAGTHQFVFKVEPDISGSADRVTAWLNPTSLASEAVAGTPIVGTYANWGIAHQVKTLTLKGGAIGANAAVGFDEFRFGTSWESLFSAPEQHIGLRQGVDGYQHLGTQLTAGNPDHNIGNLATMSVGRHSSVSLDKLRSVLGWDLSAIPQGAVITGASLTLTPDSLVGSPDVGDVELWSLVTDQPMVESQVTWNEIRSDLDWATPGGDDNLGMLLATTPWLTSETDLDPRVFSTPALVDAVQDALDQGVPLEMLLRSPAAEAISGSSNFIRWHSDDATTSAYRPLLTITYIPEPSGAMLLALAALAGLMCRRRRS